MVISSLLDWKIPSLFWKKEGSKIRKFDMPIIACRQGFYTTKKIGPEEPHFGYRQSVLDYLRKLAPGDIVGEIRDDVYKVSMQEFCDALDILTVS